MAGPTSCAGAATAQTSRGAVGTPRSSRIHRAMVIESVVSGSSSSPQARARPMGRRSLGTGAFRQPDARVTHGERAVERRLQLSGQGQQGQSRGLHSVPRWAA
jgi:hypothetical protein